MRIKLFFLLVEESNNDYLDLRITNTKINASGCKCWDCLVPASQVLQFAMCPTKCRVAGVTS